MKLPTPSRLFASAILCAFSASAQTPVLPPATPVEWNNLCANTARELLVVTTESGDTIEGYCASIQHDEVILRTLNGRTVRLARGTLKKVVALAGQEHRLQALGRGMKHGLHEELRLTFSPMAPAGLVAIPGTLAWGAVAAPFCILGDLFGGKPARRVLTVHQ